MTPIEQFISIARSWVGTKEEPLGSNRGFHIDLWNKSVGVPAGSFWCASFMSSVANRWKFMTNLDWQLGVSADCDVWLARAKRLGILHNKPQVGDIGLILNQNNASDAIHIFLVSSCKGDVWMSIEGNSNDDGSRNGTAVVERQLYRFRSKAKMVFIRWADLLDEASADWRVMIGSKELAGTNVNGRLFVPLRPALTALFGDDVETRLTFELVPLWDSGTIPCSIVLKDGASLVSLRDLASWQGCTLRILKDLKNVILER